MSTKVPLPWLKRLSVGEVNRRQQGPHVQGLWLKKCVLIEIKKKKNKAEEEKI